MTTNAQSEGPAPVVRDPATPATMSRAWGFICVFWGVVAIVAGLVGLFFFFMIPALLLTVAGIPMVVSGSRAFGRGKPRLAAGPGRFE
jgi:hypothetical protein